MAVTFPGAKSLGPGDVAGWPGCGDRGPWLGTCFLDCVSSELDPVRLRSWQEETVGRRHSVGSWPLTKERSQFSPKSQRSTNTKSCPRCWPWKEPTWGRGRGRISRTKVRIGGNAVFGCPGDMRLWRDHSLTFVTPGFQQQGHGVGGAPTPSFTQACPGRGEN